MYTIIIQYVGGYMRVRVCVRVCVCVCVCVHVRMYKYAIESIPLLPVSCQEGCPYADHSVPVLQHCSIHMTTHCAVV